MGKNHASIDEENLDVYESKWWGLWDRTLKDEERDIVFTRLVELVIKKYPSLKEKIKIVE